MAELYSDTKMMKISKAVKITYRVSMILGLVSLIMLICFNFAGVFTIQTLPGTKYDNAFTYPGWQSIFFGMGEMMIQGYTESSFNIITFLAFFISLLSLIICSILYLKSAKRKGTNRKKVILESIMAGTLVIGAFLLFFCDQLWILNASKVTGSYQNYYTEYLLPAINGEVMFKKTIYPTLLLVVSLLTCVVKIFNAGLLIYQKKYAKNAKKA
ncbi:MAG: hypothetical protein WCR67_05420 [Bacilli bacterium]